VETSEKVLGALLFWLTLYITNMHFQKILSAILTS